MSFKLEVAPDEPSCAWKLTFVKDTDVNVTSRSPTFAVAPFRKLSRLRYSGRPGTLEEVFFFEVFIFFLGTEEAPFDAEDAPDDVE